MHLDCIDIEFRHEFRGRPRCGRASTLPSTRIAPARLSAATCAARPAAQPWPAPNASSLPDSDVVGPERSCFDVTQVEPDPLSRLCHRTPPQHLSPRCSSTRQRPAD